MTLKVAIVSDTHGFLDPRVAEMVAACDLALHAGDIGDRATLDALRPRGGRVLAVRGNNDVPHQWPTADHETLLGIPWERRVSLPGGEAVLLHGHRAGEVDGLHERLRRMYPGVRAVIYGHTHSLVADIERGPWVMNPGAAGRRLTRGGPSCLILSAGVGHWRVERHRFPPLEEVLMVGS